MAIDPFLMLGLGGVPPYARGITVPPVQRIAEPAPIARVNPRRIAGRAGAVPTAPADDLADTRATPMPVASAAVPGSPAASPGPLGGFRDLLTAAAIGASQVPPDRSVIGSLVGGFANTGAFQMSQADKARAEAIAAEEKAYQRKTKADETAYQQKQKEDETAYQRGRDTVEDRRNAAADARAERKADMDALKTLTEIKGKVLEQDGQFSNETIFRIEQAKANYAKSLGLFNPGTFDAEPDPAAARKKALEEVDAYGRKLEERLRTHAAEQPEAGVPPAEVPPTESPPATEKGTKRPAGIQGKGSKDDPYSGFSSVEEFTQTVPVGGYYVDERGQLRKRTQ